MRHNLVRDLAPVRGRHEGDVRRRESDLGGDEELGKVLVEGLGIFETDDKGDVYICSEVRSLFGEERRMGKGPAYIGRDERRRGRQLPLRCRTIRRPCHHRGGLEVWESGRSDTAGEKK